MTGNHAEAERPRVIDLNLQERLARVIRHPGDLTKSELAHLLGLPAVASYRALAAWLTGRKEPPAYLRHLIDFLLITPLADWPDDLQERVAVLRTQRRDLTEDRRARAEHARHARQAKRMRKQGAK